MMKSLKIGSLIMALMLFFVGAHAQNSVEKVKIGDTMPQFTLNSDVYGQVTPSDLKGKVVLVSLFATWCGPCQKELAEVQSTLYPKYKDNENFRLLVIGREHTDADLTKYNARKKFTFPLYPDPKREVFSLFADQSIPRAYLFGKDGKLMTSKAKWWTSGFFPGVLWYLYEVNQDDSLKMYAENYTKRIENEKYTTDNHDVGFMLYCSFGNGLRLTSNDEYKQVLLQGAESLSTRFRPQVGCIRSWDWNQKVWEYPVIIDNMMNLEMLMWASKNSDNPKFAEIAKSHADVTMKHHFRPDYSSYHVISYDTISGQPEKKNTCQGYAHESCWARGQGWALYGYTMMYRETGQEKYLQHATNVARFIMNHPRLPEDKIPYWDFDAPGIPNELRDASAGALMASAFIELSQYTEGDLSKQCLSVAETQLKTLSSPEYLAEPGTNCNFILKH